MDLNALNPDELLSAVETSGKPLELEAASILEMNLSAGPRTFKQSISLGSYFADVTTDKYRELDILAELSQRPYLETQRVEISTQILCSCKGFPDTVSPITYSTRKHDGPDQSPATFMCSRKSLLMKANDLGAVLADGFLAQYVRTSRRFVGFDTLSIDSRSTAPKLTRKGDRDLFLDGWDCAVKASLYWADIPSLEQHYARLLIPLLVMPKPWLDFPIIEGKFEKPALCELGYTTTIYPMGGPEVRPRLLTTLVVSLGKLPELAQNLSHLAKQFFDQAHYLARNQLH